ncbi:MAG: MerR family DNA-binding transcriptional regulator, partial [Mycoplasmoidaceae bacterium]
MEFWKNKEAFNSWNKMKYYSTREMVKILNVTGQTLRNWDSNGKLVPHHKTDSGYRYYS